MTTPTIPFNQEIIIINPLNETQIKAPERPIWLCKHLEARVVSYDPRRYICYKCDKIRIIKIVSQKDILTTVSTNTVTVEHKD
jgi:hypothetical protein